MMKYIALMERRTNVIPESLSKFCTKLFSGVLCFFFIVNLDPRKPDKMTIENYVGLSRVQPMLRMGIRTWRDAGRRRQARQ